MWERFICSLFAQCHHLYGGVERLAVHALKVGSDAQHVHLAPGDHDPDQRLIICTRTLTTDQEQS